MFVEVYVCGGVVCFMFVEVWFVICLWRCGFVEVWFCGGVVWAGSEIEKLLPKKDKGALSSIRTHNIF
jgi:hypothetical protein